MSIRKYTGKTYNLLTFKWLKNISFKCFLKFIQIWDEALNNIKNAMKLIIYYIIRSLNYFTMIYITFLDINLSWFYFLHCFYSTGLNS